MSAPDLIPVFLSIVVRISFCRVKVEGCEIDHATLSDAKFKNAWIYTTTPLYTFMALCLIKGRDGCILTLISTLPSICLQSE
jgi:hypothetical protein